MIFGAYFASGAELVAGRTFWATEVTVVALHFKPTGFTKWWIF
jgi:hypothetical protein